MTKNTANRDIALVTGASRGIGAAISDSLAKQGICTIGTATSAAGAEAITRRLQGIHAHCSGLLLDVADKESIAECFAAIAEQFGAPSILVNNAGITRDNLLLRMSDSEWQEVINTNLNSVYHVTRAAIRSMVKARQGCIINISSVVAATGNPGQVNYSAAKAGLMGLTRSLARELGNRNIRVNCIAPGFIETDMTQALTAEQRQQLLQQIPLNRLGQTQDIADAVLFLVQQGYYITGQTLHVNGGMYVS